MVNLKKGGISPPKTKNKQKTTFTNMKKTTAKKLDKLDGKLLVVYEALEALISDDIDEQVDKAAEYAEEHENSDKAQEKLEQLETEQSELNEILETLDELRCRIQDLYEPILND